MRRDTLPLAMREVEIPLEEVMCYNSLPHPDIEQRLKEIAPLVSEVLLCMV